MKLLLDTHTLLWLVENNPQLSQIALDLLVDPGNELLLSPATYWELAIKISIRKYQFTDPRPWSVLTKRLTPIPFSVFGNGMTGGRKGDAAQLEIELRPLWSALGPVQHLQHACSSNHRLENARPAPNGTHFVRSNHQPKCASTRFSPFFPQTGR